MKVVALWSGGKESCLARYKAISEGFEISYLLNFASKDGRCMFHEVDSKLIHAQSQALEIPIIQREVTPDTYEREFKIAMHELKQKELESKVHLCGELGEYHTFVFDGPLFKRRLGILDSKERSTGFWTFLR